MQKQPAPSEIKAIIPHLKASAAVMRTYLEGGGGSFICVLPLNSRPEFSGLKALALKDAKFFKRLANIFASTITGLVVEDIHFATFSGIGESLVFIITKSPN